MKPIKHCIKYMDSYLGDMKVIDLNKQLLTASMM